MLNWLFGGTSCVNTLGIWLPKNSWGIYVIHGPGVFNGRCFFRSTRVTRLRSRRVDLKVKSYGILGRSSSGPKVEAPDKVCRWWRGCGVKVVFWYPLGTSRFFFGWGFCDKKGGENRIFWLGGT